MTIVEETRKIRNEVAAKFNYDVEKLGKHYQAQQEAEGREIIKRLAKKEKKEKVA